MSETFNQKDPWPLRMVALAIVVVACAVAYAAVQNNDGVVEGSLGPMKWKVTKVVDNVATVTINGTHGVYKKLEHNSADKVFAQSVSCKVGTVVGVLQIVEGGGEQPAICTCQETNIGHGWYCFN